MIRPAPQQQEFALAPESGPRPPVHVVNLRPAAADGEQWELAVEALCRRIAADVGSVLPSHLRARASVLRLDPPHHSYWGRPYSRPVRSGWRKELALTTSTAPSRNAARDVWRYLPPDPEARA